MSFAVMAILLAFLGVVPLALLGGKLTGARGHFGLCIAVFALTLIAELAPGLGVVRADGLGLFFGALGGFIAMAHAAVNIAFVRAAPEPFSVRGWRIHHAAAQAVLAASLLGFYADNTGLFWVAMAAASLSGAAVWGLQQPSEMARRLLFGASGLAMALLGTLLVYLAAVPAVGPGLEGLSFVALASVAAQLNGAALTLGFLLLLAGYLAAFVAVPAGLRLLPLSAALLGILRFSHLLRANGGALPPGPLLCLLGAAGLLLAAFATLRARDSRLVFRLSVTAQAGIVLFAFGVGGEAAVFAGILQLAVSLLALAALSQSLVLTKDERPGMLQAIAVFALTGLPPSFLFTGVFLLLGQTIRYDFWWSWPLGLGLVAYAAALLRRISSIGFARPARHALLILPMLQLALGLVLAFAMPLDLVRALSAAATALK